MEKYIEKSMTYDEYIELIDSLLEQGKTTGENQSEAMFNYGRLNRQRMKRLANSTELNESLAEKARSVEQKWIWLIPKAGAATRHSEKLLDDWTHRENAAVR